jgi:hypothetical protein
MNPIFSPRRAVAQCGCVRRPRYRNVAIDLGTHAIGGLSESDFSMAAKIGQLPVELNAR